MLSVYKLNFSYVMLHDCCVYGVDNNFCRSVTGMVQGIIRAIGKPVG